MHTIRLDHNTILPIEQFRLGTLGQQSRVDALDRRTPHATQSEFKVTICKPLVYVRLILEHCPIQKVDDESPRVVDLRAMYIQRLQFLGILIVGIDPYGKVAAYQLAHGGHGERTEDVEVPVYE